MSQDEQTNLSKLDWDIQPDRDLWPEISTTIRFTRTSETERSKWMPMTIAACTILAVVSVCFSLLSFQHNKQNHEMQARLLELQQSHITLMDQQHQLVRAQFVALLQDTNNIKPDVATNLQATLKELDDASNIIKQALVKQPMNLNYAAALADTYQREADLLKLFFSTPHNKQGKVFRPESI